MTLCCVNVCVPDLQSHPEWAIPHLSIPDITSLNWSALRSAGFKAVVFDKDNTLTRPFELQVSMSCTAHRAALRYVWLTSGSLNLACSAYMTFCSAQPS